MKSNWLSQLRTFSKPLRRGQGEKNSSAKMDRDKVLEIRRLSKKGVSQYEIARRYGIAQPTVNHIITRYHWGHVD